MSKVWLKQYIFYNSRFNNFNRSV